MIVGILSAIIALAFVVTSISIYGRSEFLSTMFVLVALAFGCMAVSDFVSKPPEKV
jgi:hypothetical protein